ncbi:hypothetical protein Gotur_018029 [Gossypium turneri]
MGFQLNTFGEHNTMKIISCVWGKLLSIVGLYGRINRELEW